MCYSVAITGQRSSLLVYSCCYFTSEIPAWLNSISGVLFSRHHWSEFISACTHLAAATTLKKYRHGGTLLVVCYLVTITGQSSSLLVYICCYDTSENTSMVELY
jgi:hypothetical protein